MSLDSLEGWGSFQARVGRLGRSRAWRTANAEWAGEGLRVGWPHYSAASGFPWWQKCAPLLLIGIVPFITFLMPRLGQAIAGAAISIPFLAIAMVRFLALWWFVRDVANCRLDDVSTNDPDTVRDAQLPVYSVLVPLYREAVTVPGLVAAMAALNYPCDRLEIIFVAEADDDETLDALQQCDLADHMAVLAVPSGGPRTKPRALNYALAASTGELIVIYDAEDTPSPVQLRRALQAFEDGGSELACVQARLAIHNRQDTMISRQFAVEYAALFECVLPALHCFQLPIPLGGTSNHFRREHLVACGGWDAYNVTEDADLGFRLARRGLKVGVIASDTMEEAPATFRVWLGQRTRWLKGWLQTYLVHMRSPLCLWQELGTRNFMAFQILLAGMVLSALIHPWVYVVAGYSMWQNGVLWTGSGSAVDWLVVGMAVVTFATGLFSAAALQFVAARSRYPGESVAAAVFLLPFYWLAISLAAYRAVIDLCWRPYYWEKTPHRARP